MKKVIGIINDIGISFDENSVNNGCGGSETWVIEIAKEFVKQDYYVMVFSWNSTWHYSSSYVEYIPMTMLEYRLNYQHIDYFLVSRNISKKVLNILKGKQERLHNNIYLIAHDVILSMDNKLLNFNDEYLLNNYDFFLNNVVKIDCMSNCGIQTLNSLCKIEKDKCVVIGNGLNFDLFNDLNNCGRDNNIFWSSRYERNLDVLTDKILPLLKKEIPDIKVRVAQYFDSNVANSYKGRDDIEFIGKLGKQDLYKEMAKHKVWFYPNLYVETFCITALEEAMCGCEIVMPYRHGPADIFAPFKNLLLPLSEKFETQESIEKTAQIIIDKIKNYDNNKEQRELIQKHIRENYSWENIVKQFIKLFNNN